MPENLPPGLPSGAVLCVSSVKVPNAREQQLLACTYLTISSSVVPFSSCPQSLPASGPRPGSPVPRTPERSEGLRACYWEGPSELPERRSSSSAPRRDSAEPRPRGCSGLGVFFLSGVQ